MKGDKEAISGLIGKFTIKKIRTQFESFFFRKFHIFVFLVT